MKIPANIKTEQDISNLISVYQKRFIFKNLSHHPDLAYEWLQTGKIPDALEAD